MSVCVYVAARMCVCVFVCVCVCVCPIISNFGVSDPHSSLASSFGCFPIFLKGSRLKFIFANNSFYLSLVELFGTAGDVVNKHCKQPGPLKDMHSHALNITGARGKGSRILRQTIFCKLFSAEKQCGGNGGFRLKIDEAGGADLAALSKDYCRQGQVFPISFSAAVTISFFGRGFILVGTRMFHILSYVSCL